MTLDDETVPINKRAALWVFDQLLREGVVVYTPLMNVEGVDGVVRCEDGTYRDLLIRGSAGEHHPLWFQVMRLTPRRNLFVIGVSWQVTPVQCWIFPSEEFARYAGLRGSAHDLDLEAAGPDGKPLKSTLARYRNAWRLVTDGAYRPLGGR